ncbi:hypothetical protein LWF01_08685 [Saxibacter everestensis]|uniref:DUF996 domain-containing protein n=1 Tax=Saxibacter everestensis TaxID=2909229 RepID=A0ABY8QY23_9MICO|nr:hypothetical protein LWF01_08685 [Brevibacteriaceae bacterium ZFBP1038]
MTLPPEPNRPPPAPQPYGRPPGYGPQQPYYQQPAYYQPVYYQPVYYQPYPPVYRPPRPPLSRRQRSAALWAGGIAGPLQLLGITVLGAVGSVLAFVMFAAFVEATGELSESESLFAGLDRSGWIVAAAITVAACFVGVAFFLAGLWIGRAVMRAADVHRPKAVSWSGTGINFGVNLLLSVFLWPLAWTVLSSMFVVAMVAVGSSIEAGGADQDAVSGQFAALGALGIGLSVLGLLLVIAISALLWWWMAFAYRARPADQETTG